jgi:formylglycine-generating enzyme required for sulfatase activity
MRCFLLVVFSLIFFFACEKDKVEQIKVDIPEGVLVPGDMVFIPSGNFIMGHSDYPDTKKGKVISQEAFLIDRFEVTREQFNSFDQDYNFHPQKARFPASMVTFKQAEGYCSWKGRRLPSETEWEKSARGSDGRKWAWKKYYEHPNNGFSGFIPEAVDDREEWISPYGVYGMGHNVWEWMSDWYVSDRTAKADSKRYKVIRGGVTQTHTVIKFTPTFFRNKMEPKAYFNFIGFRCACSINCS